MNALCIIIFLNIFNLCASLYLNNYQFKLINNLLRNPLLKNKERDHINIILYKAYENFAIKKAIEFKNLHKYKCSNIKIEELFFASRMGLFKSIKKYNGKYQFINYSVIYINAELYKLLTEKYSLSILPKSYRTKSKSALSMAELIKYKRLLHTKLSCQYETWQLDTIFVTNQDINEENYGLKETIHKLTPFSKRVLQLKYNLIDNIIISNKKVAKLMGCSEETIRKELMRIKQMANTE
jgi:RNA polymerase sigma factor (sigma-70 family)